MIAAGRGFFEVVEQLVTLGANVNLQASNDWTALDWARRFQRADIVELLEAYMSVPVLTVASVLTIIAIVEHQSQYYRGSIPTIAILSR